MPDCIILCGLPASGKSTFIKTCYGYKVHSTDNLIEAYASSVGSTYDAVFKDYIATAESTFWYELSASVERGENIIVDRTNMNTKARGRIAARLSGDYHTKAIAFLPPNTKLDWTEYYRRLSSRPGKTIPTHIIESMKKSWESPNLEKEKYLNEVELRNIWGERR